MNFDLWAMPSEYRVLCLINIGDEILALSFQYSDLDPFKHENLELKQIGKVLFKQV